MSASSFLKVQSSFSRLSLCRTFATQTAPQKSGSRSVEDYAAAKPFSEIPKMSAFTLIRRMMPGGRYSGLGLQEMHKEIRKEFGDITLFPAMLGRPEMVMCYSPVDFETVFRNEGIYPHRRSLESLDYYRKTVRPDVYDEFGSLFSENDEKWHQTRTLANPIMLKPQTIKLYVPQVDEIAQEFVQV